MSSLKESVGDCNSNNYSAAAAGVSAVVNGFPALRLCCIERLWIVSTTSPKQLCTRVSSAHCREISLLMLVRWRSFAWSEKIDVQIDKQILEDAKRDFEKSGGNDKKVNEFNQWSTAASNTGMATSVRVFEARIPGRTKCFLKEFLPVGLAFGRRELLTTRKLVARLNEIETSTEDTIPPFPVLLGSLKTDERVEDPAFRRVRLIVPTTTLSRTCQIPMDRIIATACQWCFLTRRRKTRGHVFGWRWRCAYACGLGRHCLLNKNLNLLQRLYIKKRNK